MMKKLLPSALLLLFLILSPLSTHAAFTCDVPSLEGTFTGVVAGTETGTPYSEFLFLTITQNGSLNGLITTFEVLGEPGLPNQTVSGSGTLAFFNTTFCFARAVVGGRRFVVNFVDNGNMILFSSPTDGNLQSAGILRRAGF